MFYRKNLPGWERATRSIGGIMMIAYALTAMPGAEFHFVNRNPG